MFIGQRYYNELNISTIEYEVKSSNKNFEVKKLKGTIWIFDKRSKKFIEADKKSLMRRSFKFLDEKTINELKIDVKEKRNQRNIEINYGTNGYGISERDVKEAESEATKAEKNYSLQKQIMEKSIEHEYVYCEGWITAYITMNNGDKYEEKISYWCNKEHYDEEKNKIIVDEKIDRTYEDDEVDIEFVYDVLNGHKTKKQRDRKDREYI